MSNKINTALIGLALLSLSSISFAAGSYNQERGQRMMQELNLTTEQQEQFQGIMKEQKEAAKEWRAKHKEATREKLSQVLTGEQMEKFDEIKKQRSEKRKMRKKNKSY
ncbi:MAG: hypothetical protein OQL19_21235 [Gammaproteobacteria bacterium]|nr:hypothetical protein [Gammaproteobacteria bacterium]